MNEPVGDELGKLIPKWIASQNDGCGCRQFAQWMNKLGADGCETHRRQIIDHLVSQGGNLIPVLRMCPVSARKAAAGWLLSKAIANVRSQSN